MITVVANPRTKSLPKYSNLVVPVQLYSTSGCNEGISARIGNALPDTIRRLRVRLTPTEMDFLSLSMAVVAADTFVNRYHAADGWTRHIDLRLAMADPDPFIAAKPAFEEMLGFLSGDIWNLELHGGGAKPWDPYAKDGRRRLIDTSGADCVALLSGGLDSAVGAINLLREGRAPIFVSHAYPKDRAKQDNLAKILKITRRVQLHADPASQIHKNRDISMRTRSLSFIAFGIVAAATLRMKSTANTPELIMPENGFISLNAPLTSRRIGSLSTRTTHPYFLSLLATCLKEIDIKLKITNPFQFMTKGELLSKCSNKPLLKKILADTVSCSHWKRHNRQCGICGPCLVRRAAIRHARFKEDYEYEFPVLSKLNASNPRKDDLLAVMQAIERKKMGKNIRTWIQSNGPLPTDHVADYEGVFTRGLSELQAYLSSCGVKA